jgi:conjugative transfer signal peptidase TraF
VSLIVATRQRRCLLGVAASGVALLAVGALAAPVLVWNASASAPRGLYLRTMDRARVGDLVLVGTPAAVRDLAARRGYVPANVPLVKRIAAASGDIVCAAGQAIAINARVVAHRLQTDSAGRPLPSWSGCRRLADGDVFLLMIGVPASFDGRYFGPVLRLSIVGKLVPLWTE